MTQIVVPVRYPLSDQSKATLSEAIRIADEHREDGEVALTVLHVNLYHKNLEVSRGKLKQAVEEEFGSLPDTRYSVRSGMLVEESILDEIAAEEADVVVIGKKQASRWRQMIQRIVDDPNIENYLRDRLDCQVVTASPDSASASETDD